MEYKIFRLLREQWRLHPILRCVIGFFSVLAGIVIVLIPLPFSVPIGVFCIVFGGVLIVPGAKVRYLIKIRKGVVHMVKNITSSWHIKQKYSDILRHFKKIKKVKKVKPIKKKHQKKKKMK